MFYDRFLELCREKGVKPGTACTEMGVSRSLAAKWKATGTDKPSAESLEKMADYFKMSIDEILQKPGERASLSDSDLKFALWGDNPNIDNSDLEDVRRYAAFVAERKKTK